ncbi:hypothetical protein IAU59_001885 [Kwoniella sp. CBS 9459]
MRITVPNPLGPPITFDSDSLRNTYSRIPSLVPTNSGRSIARRPHFKLLVFIFGLVLLVTIHPRPPFPPNYSSEWRTESRLPQIKGDIGPGEGKNGRYVKFDVPRGTGFNHQLQRVLLQHHLAVLGNRSLAFEPYVEDDTYLPFKVSSWPWRSARIPLSAYVATVISGFESFYTTPRAVPASYYRNVCPSYKEQTHTIKTDLHPEGDMTLVADGQSRIHQIQVLLAGSDQSCVRIIGEPFDDEFFDSKASLDLYESFVKSPVMKHFSFAPTVLSIINKALPDLSPDSQPYDLESVAHANGDPVRTGMWKHVLALHLRRGKNWEMVCEEKGARAAPFVSFNKLPLLPGNENVPPPPSMVEATRMGLYRAKCLPQTLDIIARARRMRKNHPLLRSVYILTDADEDAWVKEIRMWLQSEGWDHVWIGKEDVYPEWQDKEVGVAVDMEVGRRAGVFVGNGFSTTSSNIVLLRSRDGIHPDLTQFW